MRQEPRGPQGSLRNAATTSACERVWWYAYHGRTLQHREEDEEQRRAADGVAPPNALCEGAGEACWVESHRRNGPKRRLVDRQSVQSGVASVAFSSQASTAPLVDTTATAVAARTTGGATRTVGGDADE